MTHFATAPNMVRFDFFVAESGKWKYTEAIDMDFHYNDLDIHEAVRLSWKESNLHPDEDYWMVVVLEPYHRNAYPIVLTPGRATFTPYPAYERIG